MIKTILVPTDFSANAAVALRYAQALADRHQASIVVGHAYPSFFSPFQLEESNQADMKRAGEEASRAMQQFLGEQASCSNVEVSIVAKDFEEAVPQWVSKHQVDLIVMGTNGASALPQQLLGSCTFETVKNSTVPVIVVPSGAATFSAERVLFFTDYQEGDASTLSFLRTACGDQGVYRIIHIHHSGADIDEKRQRLTAWVEALTQQIPLKNVSWDVVEGAESLTLVNRIASENRGELLALTVTRRGFFDDLLGKSLAKAIINQPSRPVFLVNNRTQRRLET